VADSVSVGDMDSKGDAENDCEISSVELCESVMVTDRERAGESDMETE